MSQCHYWLLSLSSFTFQHTISGGGGERESEPTCCIRANCSCSDKTTLKLSWSLSHCYKKKQINLRVLWLIFSNILFLFWAGFREGETKQMKEVCCDFLNAFSPCVSLLFFRELFLCFASRGFPFILAPFFRFSFVLFPFFFPLVSRSYPSFSRPSVFALLSFVFALFSFIFALFSFTLRSFSWFSRPFSFALYFCPLGKANGFTSLSVGRLL